MIWKLPKTAPRDGTQIIATFRVGIPTIAIYSGASKGWCAAFPMKSIFASNPDGWYFLSKYLSDDDLIAWTEMPLDNAGME
jgi:hypothetical protein